MLFDQAPAGRTERARGAVLSAGVHLALGLLAIGVARPLAGQASRRARAVTPAGADDLGALEPPSRGRRRLVVATSAHNRRVAPRPRAVIGSPCAQPRRWASRRPRPRLASRNIPWHCPRSLWPPAWRLWPVSSTRLAQPIRIPRAAVPVRELTGARADRGAGPGAAPAWGLEGRRTGGHRPARQRRVLAASGPRREAGLHRRGDAGADYRQRRALVRRRSRRQRPRLPADPVAGPSSRPRREALRAARQWRFVPARRLDEPVPVRVTIDMAFSLAASRWRLGSQITPRASLLRRRRRPWRHCAPCEEVV